MTKQMIRTGRKGAIMPEALCLLPTSSSQGSTPQTTRSQNSSCLEMCLDVILQQATENAGGCGEFSFGSAALHQVPTMCLALSQVWSREEGAKNNVMSSLEKRQMMSACAAGQNMRA